MLSFPPRTQATLPREAVQAASPWNNNFQVLRASSMIEDEFLRVEQRPEQVGQHLLILLRVLEKALQLGEFLFARFPREAALVQIVNDLVPFLAGLDHRLYDAAFIYLFADGVAI